MVETKKFESNKIKEFSDKQNIEAFKNLTKEYMKHIILGLYFQKIYQLYEAKIYQNPKEKLDYKKMQELFYRIDKRLGKKEILTNIFPNIDFQNDKKYIQEIKELQKKYKNHSERMALLLAIQNFINKHINYPFFLAFYFQQSNGKLPENIKINQNNIDFLLDVLQEDKDFIKNDTYLQKFIEVLKSEKHKQTINFLLNNFKKLNQKNQETLLKYFGNQRKNKNGDYLYTYLGDTKIEDIIENYQVGDCTHVSLMAKHFFNKIYDGKETKMLYIANYPLQHAYNILLINTSTGINIFYIDFLGDPKKLIEDYGNHNFDVIVK